MIDRDKDVDNAFLQLDAALCLRARVVAEKPPAKSYFTETTVNVRQVIIDGKRFQVIITPVVEETATK